MKVFVRNILPMWLYRRLARLYAYVLATREGVGLIATLAIGRGITVHHFRTLLYPFAFRLTDKDKNVVFGNLIKKEVLAGPLPHDARFIVDAGGYIGDSAALLLSRYREATCLVLEPGQAHELAAKNLAPYGRRAILRRAALMGSQGSFRMLEADTGSRLISDTTGSVEVMTMDDVLKLSPSGEIDILKIDIEGAELDLFVGSCSWLASVRCVTIELHGEVATKEVTHILKEAGFYISLHGSLTVAVRSVA